jgi:hypothetical protein
LAVLGMGLPALEGARLDVLGVGCHRDGFSWLSRLNRGC